MFEKVTALIAEQLKIDPKTIKPESRLLEDLKADSANIMMLGIVVDDDALMRLKNVGDIVKYLESKQ